MNGRQGPHTCVPSAQIRTLEEVNRCPTPPGLCGQTGPPSILRQQPRRHASGFQPGYRQPRRLREGWFRADMAAAARGQSGPRSAPVLMNCLSSSARHPPSHAVFGSAPVIRNRCWISWVSLVPVFEFRQRTRSRCASPSSASISVHVSRVISRHASIREIKYRDMVSASPGPRTRR